MKQLALIGPTASGKSDLALDLSRRHNALILSIDSLSVYKNIDIASAKPSRSELQEIPHYGIDCLEPDVNATVFTFIDEYYRAYDTCAREGKNLIIVGGSSFYLKSMLEGLSEIPTYRPKTLEEAQSRLNDPASVHALLAHLDPASVEKIHPGDSYRLEKLLLIYLETGLPPSEWFRLHPPKPFISACPVLELKAERTLLRERIAQRTRKMVDAGLIDEVAELERRYGRSPNSMKAIGIVESLDFLDGKYSKSDLIEAVTIHTAQLAKRQQTFNAHQFTLTASGTAEQLKAIAGTLF